MFLFAYYYFFEAYEQGKKKGGLTIVGFFRKRVTSGVKTVTFRGRIRFVVRVCAHPRTQHTCPLSCRVRKITSVFLKVRGTNGSNRVGRAMEIL